MVTYGGSEIFGKELNKFQMWMEPIALLPQIVQCCHLHQYYDNKVACVSDDIKNHSSNLNLRLRTLRSNLLKNLDYKGE